MITLTNFGSFCFFALQYVQGQVRDSVAAGQAAYENELKKKK